MDACTEERINNHYFWRWWRAHIGTVDESLETAFIFFANDPYVTKLKALLATIRLENV